MLKLKIQEYAEAQGLNKSRLQIKSGVTLPLLTRYWNNATTEVRLEALEKIAKALGVKAGDLIEEATEPPAITPTPEPQAEHRIKPVKQPASLPEEKPRVSDVVTRGWEY